MTVRETGGRDGEEETVRETQRRGETVRDICGRDGEEDTGGRRGWRDGEGETMRETQWERQ